MRHLHTHVGDYTLLEWYRDELPKWIAKHENDPDYHDEVIKAKAKLHVALELEGTIFCRLPNQILQDSDSGRIDNAK